MTPDETLRAAARLLNAGVGLDTFAASLKRETCSALWSADRRVTDARFRDATLSAAWLSGYAATLVHLVLPRSVARGPQLEASVVYYRACAAGRTVGWPMPEGRHYLDPGDEGEEWALDLRARPVAYVTCRRCRRIARQRGALGALGPVAEEAPRA